MSSPNPNEGFHRSPDQSMSRENQKARSNPTPSSIQKGGFLRHWGSLRKDSGQTFLDKPSSASLPQNIEMIRSIRDRIGAIEYKFDEFDKQCSEEAKNSPRIDKIRKSFNKMGKQNLQMKADLSGYTERLERLLERYKEEVEAFPKREAIARRTHEIMRHTVKSVWPKEGGDTIDLSECTEGGVFIPGIDVCSLQSPDETQTASPPVHEELRQSIEKTYLAVADYSMRVESGGVQEGMLGYVYKTQQVAYVITYYEACKYALQQMEKEFLSYKEINRAKKELNRMVRKLEQQYLKFPDVRRLIESLPKEECETFKSRYKSIEAKNYDASRLKAFERLVEDLIGAEELKTAINGTERFRNVVASAPEDIKQFFVTGETGPIIQAMYLGVKPAIFDLTDQVEMDLAVDFAEEPSNDEYRTFLARVVQPTYQRIKDHIMQKDISGDIRFIDLNTADYSCEDDPDIHVDGRATLTEGDHAIYSYSSTKKLFNTHLDTFPPDDSDESIRWVISDNMARSTNRAKAPGTEAFGTKDRKVLGLLCGYPRHAVDAFCKNDASCENSEQDRNLLGRVYVSREGDKRDDVIGKKEDILYRHSGMESLVDAFAQDLEW